MALQPLNDQTKSFLSGGSNRIQGSGNLQPLSSSSSQTLGYSQPQVQPLPQIQPKQTFFSKAKTFIGNSIQNIFGSTDEIFKRQTDDLVKSIYANKESKKNTAKMQRDLLHIQKAQKPEANVFRKIATSYLVRTDRAKQSFKAGGIAFGSSLSDIATQIYERELEKNKILSKSIDNEKIKSKFKSLTLPREGEDQTIYTRKFSDKLKKWSNETRADNPTFAEKVVEGSASMVGFTVLNLATGGSAIAPVILESLMESSSVYETLRSDGKDIGEASIKADLDFGGNLIVNSILNVFELSGSDMGKIKKVIAGASMEGLQEGLQQLLSNSTTGRPIMEGVFEAMGIGAVLGGGVTLVLPSGERIQISETTKVDPKAIEPSVVQIKDTKTSEVEYKTIPKGQLKEFDNAIDNTQTGIGHQDINGKIYNLTAPGTSVDIKSNIKRMTDAGIKYTGVADIKDIPTKTASKPESDLTAEAKKYKSAEEFIKEQGTSLLHGTSAGGLENINKNGFVVTKSGMNAGNGISLTPSKRVASVFGENGGVVETVLSKDVKLVNPREFIDVKNNFGTKSGWDDATQKATEYFRQKGYDGVDFRQGTGGIPDALQQEVRIWNPDVIKTKSQLTDIYNKAKEVKPTKKVVKKPVEVKPKVKAKTPGEIKASRVAVSIEQNINEKFKDLAGFETRTVDSQSKLVANFIAKDIDKARDIVSGKEPLPGGMSGSMFIAGIEKYATDTNDLDLIKSLATSPLVSGTSVHAQELRFLAEREKNSVLANIQDLANERAKIFKRRNRKLTQEKAIKKEVKKIKESTKKITKYDWNTFIKSIEC